jgi:RES domain-containing protein
MPRTFVALEVVLSEVLDLTVGENRRLLGVSKKKMTDADWRAEMCNGIVPITNQIAQAAFDTGLEGLLVPSAATSGATNLVCFVKNLLPSSRLAVLSPEEL